MICCTVLNMNISVPLCKSYTKQSNDDNSKSAQIVLIKMEPKSYTFRPPEAALCTRMLSTQERQAGIESFMFSCPFTSAQHLIFL